MLVASEEATSGSVIKKAERMFPFSKGCSHFFCCSGVPYFARTSIFPVSGGLQLKTSEAHRIRPIISAKGAYSKLVRPALKSPYVFGRKRFHKPSALAFSFKFFNPGHLVHAFFGLRLKASTSCSTGSSCSVINVFNFSCSSKDFWVYSKSMC